jgi:NADH-quinone oxidoreductase subunit G
MHPEDAKRLHLSDGGKVALQTDGEDVVFELSLASNMASGLIIVPRHRQMAWRKLKPWPVIVPDDRIRSI